MGVLDNLWYEWRLKQTTSSLQPMAHLDLIYMGPNQTPAPKYF